MSKNRLRWITLVRGPTWGIHSLTLMISCFHVRIQMIGPNKEAGRWFSLCFLKTDHAIAPPPIF